MVRGLPHLQLQSDGLHIIECLGRCVVVLASSCSRNSLSSSSASRAKWSAVTRTWLPCVVLAVCLVCLSIIIVAAMTGVKLNPPGTHSFCRILD
jgi:hypothetical protein